MYINIPNIYSYVSTYTIKCVKEDVRVSKQFTHSSQIINASEILNISYIFNTIFNCSRYVRNCEPRLLPERKDIGSEENI